MATLRLDGDDLVLHLSWIEKVGALRGDLRVSRASVRTVDVVPSPMRQVRGLRAPGTAVPFLLALGTFRGAFGQDFVAATRKPGIVVSFRSGPWARLVVSTPEAETIAAALR
jgi:hypothetical protein